MKQGRVFSLLFLLIFLTSSALRLSLAVVDRDSDDVVEIILQQKRLPLTGECEECFQPKLYYFFAAKAIEVAKVNLSHEDSITIALQLMNFAAGEAVLVLAYILIKKLAADSERAGLLAFLLLAFNPALMAVSGMTGNDVSTILFSSTAIYFCWEYLQNNKIGWLIASGLFVSMSIATKTNAWSTAIAFFVILFMKAIADKRFSHVLVALIFVLAVPILTLLNPLSQYLINIQKFGSPVTLNVSPESFPSLFEKTYVRRPGILSIQDGFFTFKFIQLLESPRLTLGATDFPAFRTSFWADIYGTANSLHFLNSPDSWHTSPDFEITRSIFILALLPTAILILGMVLGWADLIKGVLIKARDLIIQRYYGLFDVVAIGYILATVALALRYRDYSTINAKYMYPAILAFMFLFIGGARAFYNYLSKRYKSASVLFDISILSLVVFYAIDISQMALHLYNINIR